MLGALLLFSRILIFGFACFEITNRSRITFATIGNYLWSALFGEAEESDNNKAGCCVDTSSMNALEANVRTKGTNSYYYAHANTCAKEQRDYGDGPRKLTVEEVEAMGGSNHSNSELNAKKKKKKARITNFAWADGKKSVSVYVNIEGVSEHDISVEWEARRVVFTIAGEKEDRELVLDKLHDDIRDARCKVKPSKVVLVLKKATADVSWYQLTSKN